MFTMNQSPNHIIFRYLNSLLLAVIAIALTAAFWDFMKEMPLLFSVAAVALASWYGGLGPGLLTALLCLAGVDYFLIEPQQIFLASPADLLRFSIFGFVAFLISWTESHRRESDIGLREARDELKIILNGVTDGITAQDRDGKPVFANEAAAALMGFPSTESMMRPTLADLQNQFEMLDEHDNPLPMTLLPRHEVLRTGKTHSLTFRLRRAGSPDSRWVMLTSSPIFDERRRVKLVVNILRDITEEFEISRQQAELASIVQHSEDGIISKRTDGTITSWNPGAEKLYGYTAEEAIGQPISIIFSEESREQEMQLTAQARQGTLIRRYETRRVRKNGQIVDISLTISPLRGPNNEIIGLSTIERNITEAKQLERLRRETDDRLRHVLDNLAAFVGVLSPNGLLLEANRSALEAANLTHSDVLGKPFDQTYWWAYSEDIQAQLRDSIRRAAKGETLRYDVRVRLGEDHYVVIDFMLAPIFDSEGQVQYLIPSGIDVTQRIRLTERLQQQQRRLETILNSIPGVVYEASGLPDTGTHRIDFISQHAEPLLGYSLDEWYSVDNFWSRVVHPDDWENTLAQYRETYTERRLSPVRFRCLTKSGDVIHAEAHNAVITDDSGRPISTCGVVLDVTERARRQEEILRLTGLIEQQRRQLNSLIANVPGIVFESAINPQTNAQQMQFVSDYARTLLGYEPDSWKNNPDFWRTVVYEEDWERTMAEAALAFEEERTGVSQFRCVHADGRLVDVEAYYLITQNAGQINTYGVMMDITRRKEIERALADYTEELHRSNEELQQFAYVASHDLQEPLRMVTSYLQLVEQRYADNLDDDGREFIHFAVDGATRMKTLINDLLLYSRVQRSTTEFEPVQMDDILGQVLDNLQFMIEDNAAVITHDSLPRITGNPGQMLQLLQNLLVNAMKFRRDEPPKIHIGVQRQKGEWVFSVQDNGIGIESDYLERIFIIFQRLHAKDRYPGTGIGLAICKKIVEKHGGEIRVESQPGQGTTFYFTIPATYRRRRLYEQSH